MQQPFMWEICGSLNIVNEADDAGQLMPYRSFYTTEEQIHELFAKYAILS